MIFRNKIIISILLSILILCLGENFFFRQKAKLIYDVSKDKIHYNFKKQDFNLANLKNCMRKPIGLDKNYKKKPILIYGCSFAYGENLSEEETIGYLLSEKTKRPVYNFSAPARGFQHTLFLLENDEKVTPEPEYIFYIFIIDHLRRMYINCNTVDNVKYLYYEPKNGKMIMKNNKYDLTERSYLLKEIKNLLLFFLKYSFDDEIYKKAELYFEAITDEAKKKYPGAKFVIIDYQGYLNIKDRGNQLKKKGSDVILFDEEMLSLLNSDKYKLSEDKDIFRHPNGKAWELISDYLCEKYKL